MAVERTIMLCASIARTHHKSVIADYQQLCAAGAELVELRLDAIQSPVNIKRLLEVRTIPMIAACVRKEDGGQWARTEADRQVLLRSAIVSGFDYVELDAEIAASIPRYGKTKRIISYYNTEETPEQLGEIVNRLLACDADVVRLTTKAKTPADCLRMLEVSRGATKPTLTQCTGEFGPVTQLLSGAWNAPFGLAPSMVDRKHGDPSFSWHELHQIYHYNSVTRDTPLYAVIGGSATRTHDLMLISAVLQKQKVKGCCFPLQLAPEALKAFLTVCPSLGIQGLIVHEPHQEASIKEMTRLDSVADAIQGVNTVLIAGQQRLGYITSMQAAMECLAEALEADLNEERPFRGRRIMVLGSDPLGRSVAWGLRDRGAEVIWSAPDSDRLGRWAQMIGAVPLEWSKRNETPVEAIFNGTTVGAFPNVDESPVDRGALFPGMVVCETNEHPEQTMLVKFARQANCKVILGAEFYARQVALQYKLFTGRTPPLDAMVQALRKLAGV